MKKKILVIILIIILGIFIIYGKYIKKFDTRYLSNNYLEATLLKVTSNLNGNNDWSDITEEEQGFIIIDTTFNNTVTPKDYNLRLIKYEISEDKSIKIKNSKTISNKEYNNIKEKIDNIDHFNQSIDSPSYMVNFRKEDSFIIKMSDFDINSI